MSENGEEEEEEDDDDEEEEEEEEDEEEDFDPAKIESDLREALELAEQQLRLMTSLGFKVTKNLSL